MASERSSQGKSPRSRDARRRGGLAALSVVSTLVLSLLLLTSPWALIELRSFDYLSTIAPPSLPADGPIIVAIDEPSMAEIGSQWPWPREIHGRLIAALRQAGAKAIGFDVIFAEPSAAPENDAALAAALGPDVVLAGDESLIRAPQADQLVRTAPLVEFSARGALTGIASVHLGGDGVLRQMPVYPDGFAAQLLAVAEVPETGTRTGTSVAGQKQNRLIQSFGPARTYPTLSYYQALDPENFLPLGIFRDRIVIVGLSLQNAPTLQTGGIDAFATSYTVHSEHLVAGAEVQATIVDNLAHGLSIERAGFLPCLAAVALGVLLAALLVRGRTGLSTVLVSLSAVLVLVAGSSLLLHFGRIFVSPVGPTFGFLFVVTGQAALDYAAERKSRRDITRAFSRYLSPALVERLAHDPSQLKLGGERRTLTILFCDVRGFTTIAEAMKDDPERLTTLINRLLTPLSDIVLQSGGTIDKYIGDCLMAFWNAPLDDEAHARHAVAAALDMLKAITALNNELAQEAAMNGTASPPLLRIGIGINTGDCVVGNMGSTRRFDYSVLGDSVNLASRLEGESKNYAVPLLIGEQTARLCAGDFIIAELDSIMVKGRTSLSPVYTVLDAAPPDALAEHAAMLRRKYEGGLPADDPAFGLLERAIPELKEYYAMMRSRLP